MKRYGYESISARSARLRGKNVRDRGQTKIDSPRFKPGDVARPAQRERAQQQHPPAPRPKRRRRRPTYCFSCARKNCDACGSSVIGRKASRCVTKRLLRQRKEAVVHLLWSSGDAGMVAPLQLKSGRSPQLWSPRPHILQQWWYAASHAAEDTAAPSVAAASPQGTPARHRPSPCRASDCAAEKKTSRRQGLVRCTQRHPPRAAAPSAPQGRPMQGAPGTRPMQSQVVRDSVRKAVFAASNFPRPRPGAPSGPGGPPGSRPLIKAGP